MAGAIIAQQVILPTSREYERGDLLAEDVRAPEKVF
jgi:hypothetical protein